VRPEHALVLLAHIVPALGWCSGQQKGNCYIMIRTGNQDDAHAFARGIQFIHKPTVVGKEEAFGHISAYPNGTNGQAEIKFDLGGQDVHTSIRADGLMKIRKCDIGADEETFEMDDSYAMDVKNGPIHLSATGSQDVLVVGGRVTNNAEQEQSKTSTAKEPQESDEETNNEDANEEDSSQDEPNQEKRKDDLLFIQSTGKQLLVQGAIFETMENAAQPNVTVSALSVKNGPEGVCSIMLGSSWFLQNDQKQSFGVLNGATRVLKLSRGAPKDSIVVSKDGHLGIGTPWPSVKLDVNGGVQGTSAYSSASDRRWKKNIVPLRTTWKSSLGKLKSLQPVQFEWRHDEYPEIKFGQGKQIGFIAQDVEKVLPQFVKTASNGKKSVQYGALSPVISDAVVELESELKAENRALKLQLARLTERMEILERKMLLIKELQPTSTVN